MRDKGGTQPQHLSGVADAVLPVAQQRYDPRAIWLSHGLEGQEIVLGQRGGGQMGSMLIHDCHSKRHLYNVRLTDGPTS